MTQEQSERALTVEKVEAVAVAELVARLRKPFLNDETLRHWDSWRKYIAEGGKSSWPRDAFESTIDAADEERTDAAKAISALVAERDGWKDMFEQCKSKHSGMTRLANRLNARVAELEKALYEIAAMPPAGAFTCGSIARAAITGGENG